MRGSKKLKAWRGDRSQAELARRIGTEQGTWSAWERNKKRPGVRYAVALEKLTKGKVRADDWSGMTDNEAKAAAASVAPESSAAAE